MRIKQPSHFTTRESGKWIPWPKNYILTSNDLHKRSLRTIRIKRKTNPTLFVHSLRIKIDENYKEWDCVNGWRSRRDSFDKYGRGMPQM